MSRPNLPTWLTPGVPWRSNDRSAGRCRGEGASPRQPLSLSLAHTRASLPPCTCNACGCGIVCGLAALLASRLPARLTLKAVVGSLSVCGLPSSPSSRSLPSLHLSVSVSASVFCLFASLSLSVTFHLCLSLSLSVSSPSALRRSTMPKWITTGRSWRPALQTVPSRFLTSGKDPTGKKGTPSSRNFTGSFGGCCCASRAFCACVKVAAACGGGWGQRDAEACRCPTRLQ